jgi:DNA helicase-2/ATP-dependent DNA helicase PcrA
MSENFTRDLNDVQRQAVQAGDGPVLVLAGPGSGKTRVLTHRVTHLIHERGVDPFTILAVTFTNKAAREMKERLAQMVGTEQAAALTVGTFHSICARFLRRDIVHLERERDFVIYDSDDQERLMRQTLRQLDLDEKKNPPRAILGRISNAKNRLISPEQFASEQQQHSSPGHRGYRDKIDAMCYERYQALLLQNNALDFDDLLMETVRLFREYPNVLAAYHHRYTHILVDEYQDTNHAQYFLVQQLAAKHRQLFVVGDEDQSIYGWRGANRENILRFEHDYPEAQIFLLEQNYRSTQAILDTARAIIRGEGKKKHIKNLWTENGSGETVVLIEGYDANDEAFRVSDEIVRLVRSGEYCASDCAVMYRINAQSRALEEAFVGYGLPYQIVGGTRFYERKEVRDVMAYLRLILNQADNVNLERIINVPRRSIGHQTTRALQAWANEQSISMYQAVQNLTTNGESSGFFTTRARNALRRFFTMMEGFIASRNQLDLPDLIDEVLATIGFRDMLMREYGEDEGLERWQNVQELRRVAGEYTYLPKEDQLRTFLEESALYADLDRMDTQTDAVTCITLHQAKGLEFPVVFLVGLEEGLIPHNRSMDDREKVEEERRLLYVGATRARQRLYLLYAFRRGMYGEETISQPSRFLASIPPSLIEPGGKKGGGKGGKKSSSTPGQGDDLKKSTGAPRPESTGTRGNNKSKAAGPPPSGGRTPQFQPGQRVHHKNYGEGVVVSSRVISGDEEVVVNFTTHGKKQLLAGFSYLKPVK